MPDLYKYSYKRTPKSTMTLIKIRYPGHDIWYKVREEIATGKKWYQPYCPCGGYRSDNWYPSRGQRVERIVTHEHLNKVASQGTLLKEGEPPPDTYGDGWSPSHPNLHDHTL